MAAAQSGPSRIECAVHAAQDYMGWTECVEGGVGTDLFGCEEPELQLKGAAQKCYFDRGEDWHVLIDAVENGASINDLLSVRGPDQETPLHLAAEWDRLDAAQALIRAGADVNAVSASSVTPLHCAARYSSFDTLRELLDHGADVNARAPDL